MELKEFIKEVITSTAEGVIEAKEQLKDKDVLVNATMKTASKPKRILNNIDIEVSVSTDESVTGSKGLGVAKFVYAGYKSENTERQSIVNKIKFSVPISLPADYY